MKKDATGEKPNALRDATHRVRKGYAQSYGLVVPTDVYPLYENAGRAAYGQLCHMPLLGSHRLPSGVGR